MTAAISALKARKRQIKEEMSGLDLAGHHRKRELERAQASLDEAQVVMNDHVAKVHALRDQLAEVNYAIVIVQDAQDAKAVAEAKKETPADLAKSDPGGTQVFEDSEGVDDLVEEDDEEEMPGYGPKDEPDDAENPEW